MNEQQKTPVDFYSTVLFQEVQQGGVFADSKTFVDCVPKKPIGEILKAYDAGKDKSDFNLTKFVLENFALPDRPVSSFKTDSMLTMEQHITRLWPVLTRKADAVNVNASLISLPDQYIVPGGRFSEIYYWDSYFTMLGLKVQGRYDLIDDMVGNFAFLIDSLGFIPNGNRNYYLSRSQPPFFSLMVQLLEDHDSLAVWRYLPVLRKEYAFWMNGMESLKKPGDAYNHTVMMPDGTVLNRYYDNRPEPRPEAYKEDVALAKESGRDPVDLYTDIRSAAESGWDFSSRWFSNGQDLSTIQTTSIIPVDLNSLLYHLEDMIMRGMTIKGLTSELAAIKKQAEERKKAILAYSWNSDAGYFFDYNFETGKQTGIKSLAGVYPMFFGLIQEEMGGKIAAVIEKDFLKPGGLLTSVNETGQQWDSPNGWAPLQWMAYRSLARYQHDRLAAEVRRRWLRQNERVFEATGKMMEKYNVMDTTLAAGGGEYPNQDGFGWTNGVALAMKADLQKIVKQ